MKKIIFKAGILAAVFSAIAICGFANSTDVSATKVHLRITPVSLEHEMNPGTTKSGTFTVYNDADNTLHYNVSASPYYVTSKDDGGLDVSYNKESTHTQIVDWVTFTNGSGEIGPNSQVEIGYTVKVPNNAPGGGQYAALLVSATDSEGNDLADGSNISEVANVGPVLYAKISGDIITTGDILSNDINGFLFNPPITASSKVQNTGNVHADATYIMRVYPIFGGESIYNNEEHPGTATLLPDSTRYYTTSWTADEGAPSIGIYKVQSEVRIFDQVSKVEKVVIICPMWVLILIIIFILAVIFWIVSRAKARKAEKK